VITVIEMYAHLLALVPGLIQTLLLAYALEEPKVDKRHLPRHLRFLSTLFKLSFPNHGPRKTAIPLQGPSR
jgi:hypothetical protein